MFPFDDIWVYKQLLFWDVHLLFTTIYFIAYRRTQQSLKITFSPIVAGFLYTIIDIMYLDGNKSIVYTYVGLPKILDVLVFTCTGCQ